MRVIKKGATSQTLYFEMLDNTSSVGGRKTGLAFNTSSLQACYTRTASTATLFSLVSQTASAAWSSGGFAEVHSTTAPGIYRIDIPDAAFVSSTGVDAVVVTVSGASGMAQQSHLVQLTGFDAQDSVRIGISALPNVAAGASSGLPLAVDASGRVDVLKINGTSQTARDIGASVLLSNGTGTGQVSLSSGTVTVGTNNDKTAYALTAGSVNSVADGLLDRDMNTGSDTGSTTTRTVRQALRALRNKWTVSGGTYTVYKEDDTTASWTAAVSTDSTGLPIVANDPAG